MHPQNDSQKSFLVLVFVYFLKIIGNADFVDTYALTARGVEAQILHHFLSANNCIQVFEGTLVIELCFLDIF